MISAETINTDPLFTAHEAADYLAIGVGSVNYWRHKKTGPRFIRVGRQVRYRRSDLDTWLDTRTEATAS